MDFALFVELVVVIRAEIFENLTSGKHMVYSNEHGMGDCNDGPFLAATNAQTLVLRIEIRCFHHHGKMGTLNQCGLKCLVSFGSSSGLPFTSTFVVAG